jgi:hypothetical protein
MKRIINGKTYSTETAELVAEFDNGLPRSDFHCREESLYRTKKGALFLHGRGGGLTRWAGTYGNMRGWGESIEALTESEALDWCERHTIAPDTVAQYFDIEEA